MTGTTADLRIRDRARPAGVIVVDTGETSRSSDLEVAAGLRGRVRGYASNRFPR
jgi:hypothetical protein